MIRALLRPAWLQIREALSDQLIVWSYKLQPDNELAAVLRSRGLRFVEANQSEIGS